MERQFYNRDEDNNKKGIIISTMVHMLLLLLILSPFFSFTSHEKDRPLSGIVVAIGNPNATIQEYKPSAKSEAAKASQPAKTKAKTTPTKVSKPKVAKTPSKATKVISKTVQEDADVIASKKATKQNEKPKKPTKSAKEIQAEKEAKEAELKAQEEARRAEEEARRQAEKAAAAAKAKADAKSKFSNMLNNGGQAAPASKGNLNGKPNAKALEGISTGSGQTGEGLGDRKLLYQPSITDNSQKTGKVIIRICVDKSGKVSKAKYTQKGSTTTDAYLIKLAEDNARQYKFDKGTIEEQCGNVIIDFKLR